MSTSNGNGQPPGGRPTNERQNIAIAPELATDSNITVGEQNLQHNLETLHIAEDYRHDPATVDSTDEEISALRHLRGNLESLRLFTESLRGDLTTAIHNRQVIQDGLKEISAISDQLDRKTGKRGRKANGSDIEDDS